MHTKLGYTFEIMELDDGFIAVPIGGEAGKFKGVIKLNETAADIFKLLESGVTESQIVSILSSEYDAPRDKIARDVRCCLDSFEQQGIVIS